MNKPLHGKALLIAVLRTHESKWLLEYIEGCIVCVALARENGGRWAERSHRICIAVATDLLKSERGIDLDQY